MLLQSLCHERIRFNQGIGRAPIENVQKICDDCALIALQ